MAMADAEFSACIQTRLGGEIGAWGKVTKLGKRFSYPLKLMHAEQFYAKRFVLVGDSAHGIHPIAGQGVNLGYRDVAALTELLIQQRRVGLDIGAESLLAHYQRWRRFDSFSMTASTDLLNRLFSNNSELLGLARRAGLMAVERMPRLKHYFMRHAMGMLGDLPKMLKEAA
jgi:2-octaprenyl-6-methoxyphenol hydroxylase